MAFMISLRVRNPAKSCESWLSTQGKPTKVVSSISKRRLPNENKELFMKQTHKTLREGICVPVHVSLCVVLVCYML